VKLPDADAVAAWIAENGVKRLPKRSATAPAITAIRTADGPITFRRGGGRNLTFVPIEGVKLEMSVADLLLAGNPLEPRKAKRKPKLKPGHRSGKNRIKRLDAIAKSLHERIAEASAGVPMLRKIK